MNQKTTYEVTITGKLDQLPIPDLREAIWARIEGELDADMPTDDGGDTPPSAPSGGGGKALQFALPVLVVLLVTFFLIKPNQKDPQPINNPQTTPASPTVTTTPTASPPPVVAQPDASVPVQYPGKSVVINSAPMQTDSAAAPVTDISLPVTDNTNQQAPPLVQTPPPQPVKTDSVAQKKRRGVSGITDNDYRITPIKPDSSRKNDR